MIRKGNKIFIFAEIGKSNLSSKASEDLLNDLVIKLNQNYKKILLIFIIIIFILLKINSI